MVRLVIYAPFPRGAKAEGDIRTNVEDLEKAPKEGFKINNVKIDEIVSVYLGEEDGQVRAGDYICVHGHGGSGRYTSVTDNRGSEIELTDLMDNLDTLNAENAAAIYFFICFSDEKDHIADVWHQQWPNQDAYGCRGVAQGGIIFRTRTRIKSSIFDQESRQLRKL